MEFDKICDIHGVYISFQLQKLVFLGSCGEIMLKFKAFNGSFGLFLGGGEETKV